MKKEVNGENDLASVYNRYVNDLFTYGCYLGFERESVKDAIQDVFVKVSAPKVNLKEISQIKFYLFKSLKNRLYDLYRQKKDHLDLDELTTNAEMPFNIDLNIEDLLIEEEESVHTRNEITKMLSLLTHRQREIVYLRYVQEYEYHQIADLLDISVNGCRKLVSKALQKLREEYGNRLTQLITTLLLTLTNGQIPPNC